MGKSDLAHNSSFARKHFVFSINPRTKRLRSFELLLEALVAVYAPLFLISASSEELGERIMKGLITTLGLVLVFLCELFGKIVLPRRG